MHKSFAFSLFNNFKNVTKSNPNSMEVVEGNSINQLISIQAIVSLHVNGCHELQRVRSARFVGGWGRHGRSIV